MAHYVAFTGGRDYTDRTNVASTLRILKFLYDDDLRVIHGAAPGADTLVDEECRRLDIRQKPFPANWTTYGKPAGVIRNTAMCRYLEMCRDKGHTIEVVAFPGGKGTNDMIAQAAEILGVEADRV